jgi:hypothetical protein
LENEKQVGEGDTGCRYLGYYTSIWLTLLRLNEINERWRKVVRDTTFNGRNRNTFSAMKVPRQCPLVLLEK